MPSLVHIYVHHCMLPCVSVGLLHYTRILICLWISNPSPSVIVFLSNTLYYYRNHLRFPCYIYSNFRYLRNRDFEWKLVFINGLVEAVLSFLSAYYSTEAVSCKKHNQSINTRVGAAMLCTPLQSLMIERTGSCRADSENKRGNYSLDIHIPTLN